MTKQKKEQILHQHIDKKRIKFGSLHPVDAKHKKEQTQKFHDLSMENGT